MSEATCVFCKIVAGQIPALRVFEDDATLAFIDIGPLADGHLLVIPKEHYQRLEDVPPEVLAAVARNLPRLGRAVTRATSAPGYNLLQNNGKVAGQQVLHVHFHIIPRAPADGLGYRWNVTEYPPGRAQEMQQRIIAALSS